MTFLHCTRAWAKEKVGTCFVMGAWYGMWYHWYVEMIQIIFNSCSWFEAFAPHIAETFARQCLLTMNRTFDGRVLQFLFIVMLRHYTITFVIALNEVWFTKVAWRWQTTLTASTNWCEMKKLAGDVPVSLLRKVLFRMSGLCNWYIMNHSH